MTGAHGRVLRSFWTDPDIKYALSIEQKALLLYFFTSPHSTMVGAYYVPLGYIAAEIGLAIDVILSAIEGPLAPFLTYDTSTEEVLVYNMARHQIGEDLKGGDRRKPMVERLLAGIHSPRLRAEFLRRYGHWELQVPGPRPTTEQPNPSAAAISKPTKPHPKGHRKPHPGKGASDAPTHARAVAVADAAAGSASGSGAGAAGAAANGASTSFRAAPYIDDWRELRQGIPEPGPIAKYTKPVEGEVGPDEARRRWRRFLQERQHSPPAYFAQEHGQYAEPEPGEIRYIDEEQTGRTRSGSSPSGQHPAARHRGAT